MAKGIRVFLTGGEHIGWALDADVATTRQTLAAMPDLVRLTDDLAEAEVVHSVWEEPILRMNAQPLDGKKIICHVCNEVMRTFEMPVMARAGERIGLWLPISREAEANLQTLGYPSAYVPYTVDTIVFQPKPPAGVTRAALRTQLGLPADAYVIGNFMRDSRVNDITKPKPQKGVELLLEILRGLHTRGLPVHVLLAGPRRHWLRAQLRAAGIPFTFAGREIAGDDIAINILDPATVNRLYHASDLHLVTSRWEGGPRAALEATATRTKIVSTPVGMSRDILEPVCLFSAVDEARALIERDIRESFLDPTVEPQYRRIRERHVPDANVPLLRSIYEKIDTVPTFRTHAATVAPDTRRWPGVGNTIFIRIRHALRLPPPPGAGLCIGIWHEFHKPPYGGGNQFMMALRGALERQGARVLCNCLSARVDVHLCNSAWFDTSLFEGAAARGSALRMIHRVDGPVALYRGTDWAEDEKIHSLNRRFAAATVFQSAWCFRKLREHGLEFVRPVIIRNAMDPKLFFPPAARPPPTGRKLRLISSAWSDNPNKGGPFYKWLDEHLDWSRFDYSFVGRVQQEFKHIRHVPPQNSARLGALLREHDIYITASRNEPCSNALLEAMACGLPALYLDHGGHGELVGFGGLPFHGEVDALTQLDRLANNVEAFRACRWMPTIDEIARQYIGLAHELANR